VDRASRVVHAPPDRVYQAFIDPEALVRWLPPDGMSLRIDSFEPHAGGDYCMTLTYDASQDIGSGKTSDDSDAVLGRFVRLDPGKEVVHAIEFQSDDPAFAGTMIMTWTLVAVPGGTDVRIDCENVPYGISADDHQAGMSSTLAKLAAYLE
jgi:uncharacterized protein YndB with AHSA1/START domain